ncbi:hypothetical protein GCK32_013500 [Trichostrongylus colubriformis]|uniref:Uncharacterized protein n=1 Tax=Trichostrongylus colubriformis TaxID=6319 RepID=A0AAN8G953_TRICO
MLFYVLIAFIALNVFTAEGVSVGQNCQDMMLNDFCAKNYQKYCKDDDDLGQQVRAPLAHDNVEIVSFSAKLYGCSFYVSTKASDMSVISIVKRSDATEKTSKEQFLRKQSRAPTMVFLESAILYIVSPESFLAMHLSARIDLCTNGNRIT